MYALYKCMLSNLYVLSTVSIANISGCSLYILSLLLTTAVMLVKCSVTMANQSVYEHPSIATSDMSLYSDYQTDHRSLMMTTTDYKITASDGAASDQFGYSVSNYGDYVIVGAYGDDSNRGILLYYYFDLN